MKCLKKQTFIQRAEKCRNGGLLLIKEVIKKERHVREGGNKQKKRLRTAM